MHCYATWLLEAETTAFPVAFSKAAPSHPETSVPFAFSKSAPSQPKHPRSPETQTPNQAPRKMPNTYGSNLPSVPALPLGDSRLPDMPTMPLGVSSVPSVSAMPLGGSSVPSVPSVSSVPSQGSNLPDVAAMPIGGSGLPSASNPLSRLTAMCTNPTDRPQILDEIELDSRKGLWKVTLAAMGKCATGTGQGKKAAKQDAAKQILEDMN